MLKQIIVENYVANSLTLDEYQLLAARTATYGAGTEIIYPTLGLANEAGEVAGKVKKVLRDNDGFFTHEYILAIKKELGDTLWYLAMTAKDLNLSLGEIAQENLNKLADRAERGVIGGDGDNR